MKLAVRVFSLWLLFMLVGIVIVWNSRFSTDISFFLPSKPSIEQRALVGQLQGGAVSRLLMISVEGGEVEQRAAVSRELRQRLAASPAYVSVQNGETGGLEEERDVLFRYRYQLSPAITPERFTVEGLQSAVTNTIDMLSSPIAMMFKPYLTHDPTGELLEVIGQFNPDIQPETRAGVWASRNGERAMLLVQTRALGADTDGQAFAIASARESFEQVIQSEGRRDMAMQISGPGHFAVQARETIKSEISRLFFISMGGIVGVLLWVYRSPRLLAFGLMPMLSGALAGVVMVSMVYGTVFGITVGFGSALIGEAVDYAVYFFIQTRRLGLDNWRRLFWPTVRLGVMTSTLGFGALLFSSFPGLSQLGLYALTGVVTAAMVTRFVLPTLAGEQLGVAVPGPWVQKMLNLLNQTHRLQSAVFFLAMLAGVYLWLQRDTLWDANLSALSTVSQSEAAIDTRMRTDLAAPDARYLVTINAENQESALQIAERVSLQLDRLVEAGAIGGYDSPSRILPSEMRQRQRLASIPAQDVLEARLQATLVDSPLSADKLAPFVADAQAARIAGVMRRADLDGSALALAVDSMLTLGQDGRWSVMMPLRPTPGAAGADIPVELLRATLEGSGALFVDMKTEFDLLYSGYVDEAVQLSLAGFLAIVLLLAITLRSIKRLLHVLLALMLTVVGVIAMLHLAGEHLHLLHLVGMLLIVAVGSNYALFFDRAAGGEPLDTATLLSMAVATITTVIGFGTLALSSVPVLRAIGITVGPGALLALLLSAVLVYPAGGK